MIHKLLILLCYSRSSLWKNQHIEAENKWPTITWLHFQIHFREWKYVNSFWDFTEVCSQLSKEQYSNTGSDDGLAPARRQAIIWTDDG